MQLSPQLSRLWITRTVITCIFPLLEQSMFLYICCHLSFSFLIGHCLFTYVTGGLRNTWIFPSSQEKMIFSHYLLSTLTVKEIIYWYFDCSQGCTVEGRNPLWISVSLSSTEITFCHKQGLLVGFKHYKRTT